MHELHGMQCSWALLCTLTFLNGVFCVKSNNTLIISQACSFPMQKMLTFVHLCVRMWTSSKYRNTSDHRNDLDNISSYAWLITAKYCYILHGLCYFPLALNTKLYQSLQGKVQIKGDQKMKIKIRRRQSRINSGFVFFSGYYLSCISTCVICLM